MTVRSHSPNRGETRRDVELPGHDGSLLRGWLYLPVSEGPSPAVVMTHGFSATKEMALDRYAEVLCEAGIAVLVYDHRGLGASDGEPRQVVHPWIQARDVLVALDWLAACDEVDPGRLGVWGSSFSGGVALVVGAMDARIRAVVANVPFVGQPTAPTAASSDAFDRLAAGVRAASMDSTSLIGPLAVVSEEGVDLPAVMPQPEAAAWFLDVGCRPGARWRNEAWLPGGTSMGDFDPAVAIPHLHGATLFVLASDDTVAPTASGRLAFDLAPEPKELVVIDGHHFTPYAGEALVTAASAARDLFLRWL